MIAPSDSVGYIWIFEVVIVIHSITAFISTKVNTLIQYEPLVFKDKLILKKGSQWRYVIISHFLFGVRDSITLFLTGLLIYNAVSGNGSMYGNLLTFFAILGILSNTVASKLIKRNNRLKMYQRGSFVLFTSTIVLVFAPNIYGALYFGIANSIASPFYFNPFSIIMMNAIQDYSEKENINVRIILKESALGSGRLIGMVMIVLAFFTLPESYYLKVAITFSSCFALILVYFAKNYHIARDKRKHEQLQ
jgi:YQGE family putative transporter